MFGKIVGICAALTPNHDASVAAYCTLPVDGTHRPFVPESSGPFSASVGNVPYICPPFTAPPSTMWCDPHAWSLPVFEFGWKVRLKSDMVNEVTLALHAHLHRRRIERGQRGADSSQQRALQHASWSECVSKFPIPQKEYLPRHAQRRSHLDDLRNLLQLRRQPVIRRKHRSQRRHRLHAALNVFAYEYALQ
jgi:hypothetical protein